MIFLAPLLEGLALLATAIVVHRAATRARARQLATVGTTATLLLSVLLWALARSTDLGIPRRMASLTVQLMPTGLFALSPMVTAAIAVVATAMSPLTTHAVRTFTRTLLVLAVALFFLGTRNPAALAVLWAMSSAITWYELRDREPGLSRLFAFYHVPSALLFAGGAMLLGGAQAHAGLIMLVLGIVIREAVVPVQSWFPRFVERAPMGLVVAFSGPQLGVYAQLELLSAGIPPDMAHQVAWVGAITGLLAAALATVQRDARRAMGYLIISQTGLIAFGLENDSPVALSGALLTWQVLALATSGFAMSMAAIFARRGVLWLDQPSGSFAHTPRMAAGFLLLGLSTVGFPLTLGFVAEDLLVQGAVEEYPWLALSLIVTTALNGITVMRSFFNLFAGQRNVDVERDLSPREIYALSVVMVLLFLGGIVPGRVVSLHVPTHTAHQSAHGSGNMLSVFR